MIRLLTLRLRTDKVWHPRAKCGIPMRPYEELPLNRLEGCSAPVVEQGPLKRLTLPQQGRHPPTHLPRWNGDTDPLQLQTPRYSLIPQ